MKALLIGDVHLRDTPPVMCTEDYLLDLFTLLHHVARIATQRNADAVIVAGDLYDNKIPNKNSHRLQQATIELLLSFPCPVYVVPGNHDMTHDLFESVFDSQPLGVLLKSGTAHLLSEWAVSPRFRGVSYSGFTTPDMDLPIYGVPWLQEWDYEYEDVRDAAVHEALESLDSPYIEHTLVVAHAPFFPPGKESPYESYSTKKFSRIAQSYSTGPISVFYGHIHDYHGVYEVDGVKFANAGALSRGSLHEYNLERGIFVTEWDSDTGEFEVVPVPHRPASEVFKLEKAEEIKKNAIDMEDFLSTVDQTTIEMTTIHAVVEHIKTLKLGNDVMKIVKDLLEEAQK